MTRMRGTISPLPNTPSSSGARLSCGDFGISYWTIEVFNPTQGVNTCSRFLFLFVCLFRRVMGRRTVKETYRAPKTIHSGALEEQTSVDLKKTPTRSTESRSWPCVLVVAAGSQFPYPAFISIFSFILYPHLYLGAWHTDRSSDEGTDTVGCPNFGVSSPSRRR